MRTVLALCLVLTSCDRVFGLVPRPIDAPIDTPIDGSPPDIASDAGRQVRIPILTSEDDSLEDPDTTMQVSYPYMSLYTNGHWGAFRFTLPLEIAAGATITVAYLEAVIDSASEDSPAVEITTEAIANPPPFTVGNSRISQRITGTARVAWNGTRLGEGVVQSPSLVSLITERVTARDWVPGSSVMLILDAMDGSMFELRQFDHVDTFVPTLVLEWSN
ncbi:MAG: hypothetical protein ACKV2T_27010 [Kofleriaceae bacterium]